MLSIFKILNRLINESNILIIEFKKLNNMAFKLL